MAVTRIIFGLLLLVLILSGCSRTHPAETVTELHDELRIIAAAGRAYVEDNLESDDICVARRIRRSAVLRSAELPATGLDRPSKPEATRPELSRGRMLADDRAILEAMGEVVLGPSCAGTRFLTFTRVQFGHDAALVTATLGGPCGATGLAFKLRQAGGAWHVVEKRIVWTVGDFSCPNSSPIRSREGFFRLIGQRRINWLPPSW